MASNTKRELILQNIVLTLQNECSEVKYVQRDLIKSMQELMKFSLTQLPVASVVGGLPSPEAHESRQGGRGGNVYHFRSNLNVGIYVYYQDLQTPDETLSVLANDLWKALLKDATRGGHATKTIIKPDPGVARLGSSYYGFLFNVQCEYYHGIDSI